MIHNALVILFELGNLINNRFGARDRQSRQNFRQKKFSDEVSEIDEPLSVNNLTTLFFQQFIKIHSEHSKALEEDGFIHMIHEMCNCSKICLNIFCTQDIVNYVY